VKILSVAVFASVNDSVPYLAVEVTGVVGVYVVVVTVAVLMSGFGVGAEVTEMGPRTQLAEAPTASEVGNAGAQADRSV
jgi:hypothetical protein